MTALSSCFVSSLLFAPQGVGEGSEEAYFYLAICSCWYLFALPSQARAKPVFELMSKLLDPPSQASASIQISCSSIYMGHMQRRSPHFELNTPGSMWIRTSVILAAYGDAPTQLMGNQKFQVLGEGELNT